MLLLVDGSNMAFRAHCALPPLTDREGRPCSAIFGTLKLLRSLVTAYPQARGVAVTFDTAKSAYRLGLYPEYKAHRKEVPDRINRAAYYQQVPYLVKLISLLVPVLTSDQVEADDILAWLASRADPENVTISSTDRDLYQLVDERVHVVDAFKKEATPAGDCEITPLNFFTISGTKMDRYVDFRTLVGDTSDNIKGIKGIGPVKAAKLLDQYGTVQKMVDAKVGVIAENSALLERNRNLMRLDLHTKQPEHFEALEQQLLAPHKPDHAVFKEALEALSFKSLADDFMNWSSPFSYLSTNPILNTRDSTKVAEVHSPGVSSVPREETATSQA